MHKGIPLPTVSMHMILFLEADVGNVKTVWWVMMTFVPSGIKMNFSKTKLFFINSEHGQDLASDVDWPNSN